MAIDIYTTLEELQQGLKLQSNRRYRIVLRPKVVAARFSGMLFETNKSFLLPAAIPHIKKNLPRIIQTRSDNKLLIVGHTDTSGDTAYNDELSLERASAVQAFLQDDVAACDHGGHQARLRRALSPGRNRHGAGCRRTR